MMEQSGVSFVIIVAESKEPQGGFVETSTDFSGNINFHVNTTLQMELSHLCLLGKQSYLFFLRKFF